MFNFQKNDLNKAKKIAEDFLRKITPEARVDVVFSKDEVINIDVKVDDPQMFIGDNAQTLLAVQHLLRVILRKALGNTNRIDLDINNYKKKRQEYLKELAVSAANEVALSKKEKLLPVLDAYERRIIHMELSERSDVKTESRGQDPDRRIVIIIK